MEVYLASDAFGSDLRAAVRERLEAQDRVCRVIDLGEAAYYDAAAAVARAVAERRLARGVLVCGTGAGVCMVANKHPGVMAVLARDADDAAEARSISGANVLCLGQMRTSPDVAGACVDAFLGTGVGAPCRASGGGAWSAEIEGFIAQSTGGASGAEAFRPEGALATCCASLAAAGGAPSEGVAADASRDG
eukprot:PRCOL_00001982-RA